MNILSNVGSLNLIGCDSTIVFDQFQSVHPNGKGKGSMPSGIPAWHSCGYQPRTGADLQLCW